MIQFCKSVLELKLFWLDDKKSKTVEIVREKAHPTDEYKITGTHYKGVPKYKQKLSISQSIPILFKRNQ